MTSLLLTGATGHIGSGLKDHFTAKGYKVIAPDRTECDLAKSGSVTKYLKSIDFKDVEFIINNAADQSVFELANAKPTDIEKMLQTNFNSIAEEIISKSHNTNNIYHSVAGKHKCKYTNTKCNTNWFRRCITS